MDFAGPWLEKRALFPELIRDTPDLSTGIIVVVPAFDEPEITNLLDSLILCDEPECKTEVIIIVNAPGFADNTAISNNIVTVNNIDRWRKIHTTCFFRLYVIDLGQPSIVGWGAGLARKAGMDEALRRFSKINNRNGVIVSLDADCSVEKSYFKSIHRSLILKQENKACSIYFEHPLSGTEYPEEIYRSISLYELHLRYYVQALKFTGFPYAFHTVGSAIAFKAGHYLSAGGMNRKQAGEDFYLIQKLVMQDGYFNLNSTIVHPSPRVSLRVPFGTGPSMNRLMEEGTGIFQTYNLKSFQALQDFFNFLPGIYKSEITDTSYLYNSFPQAIRNFLGHKQWNEKIIEIKTNTSGEASFRKRFFAWFNMFMIVKYLNHVHKEIFKKEDVIKTASELLTLTGQTLTTYETRELLKIYRQLDRERS